MSAKMTTFRKRQSSRSLIPQKDPFKVLIDTWLNDCRANGLAQQSIRDYTDKISRFHWWWDKHTGYSQSFGTHPKYVTDQHLREFASYLREPKTERWGVKTNKPVLSPQSVTCYGRVIKTFFNWLENGQHIDRSPFTKAVKFNPVKKDRVIKNIQQDNLVKLFHFLTEPERLRTFTGVRNLAIISLLADSGMRRGELLSLELSDIDLTKMRCTIRGKTGQRWAYFSERCKGPLLDYLKYRYQVGKEGPLWLTVDGERMGDSSFGSLIRRLKAYSGVKFHAHQFRHTFALLMSSRVSVFELRDMLGHSNITTTMIYVQNSPDRIADAHQNNSPLTILQSELSGLKTRGRPRRFR